MTKNYFLNPLAVLFHTELDRKNGHKTIAYNTETEEIFKINCIGYIILKAIDENPGIGIDGISSLVSGDVLKVENFLESMKKENIVLEK